MPEILTRHRPLTLLATVLVAQILLLAFQIKRNSNVRLIRYWASEIVTPGERAASWTFSGIGDIWDGYIALRGAHAENLRLHQEVGQLELRNQELENQSAEANRLSALFDFREAHREAPMLAAQVIGGSADLSSHTLFINKGERAGIRRNQAVITPHGIVGKIVEVSPGTAQVLLINDRDSGVGALFADTRTQGILKGTGDPEPVMDYVTNDEKVHQGQVILTSGEDRIFPKGLLIGTVSGFKPGNPFQTIDVQSAARLDRLEDVLVLLSQKELHPGGHDAAGSVVVGLPPEPAVAPVKTTPASPATADVSSSAGIDSHAEKSASPSTGSH
ncbi:MAG: rod shape-determining protein MreC [Candidatus Acidiferrales bacterium]